MFLRATVPFISSRRHIAKPRWQGDGNGSPSPRHSHASRQHDYDARTSLMRGDIPTGPMLISFLGVDPQNPDRLFAAGASGLFALEVGQESHPLFRR